MELTKGRKVMEKKAKAIDLGALQEIHDRARKEFLAGEKAMVKAVEVHDKAKIAYGEAVANLKAATRTVVGA